MRAWTRVDSVSSASMRWAIARALRDSAAADSFFRVLVAQPNRSPNNLELWPAQYGISPIADAERLYTARLAEPSFTQRERNVARNGLFRVAAIRGRAGRAVALSDSVGGGLIPIAVLGLALAEPSFTPIATKWQTKLDASLDTLREPEPRASTLCVTELWRLHEGDTTRARRAAAEMRKLVKPQGPAPGWRVGTRDICPLMLEAWLDRRPGTQWKSASLDRLEAALLGGPMDEWPSNTAHLQAARWRAEQGDTARALTLIRRRDPMSGNYVQPASWRLEGDLALATGDSIGAVRAFTRYLEIRDQPDPGPLELEARAVRARLAALSSHRSVK